MDKTFKGAARFKDGTKHVYDVGNLDTWQEALVALKDQPNVVCGLVLVPKIPVVIEKEYA